MPLLLTLLLVLLLPLLLLADADGARSKLSQALIAQSALLCSCCVQLRLASIMMHGDAEAGSPFGVGRGKNRGHSSFEQVPLADGRQPASDQLSPHGDHHQADQSSEYDSVLGGNSGGLRASLAHSGEAQPDMLTRWRFWCADPANIKTKRALQVSGVLFVFFLIIIIIAAAKRHHDDDSNVQYGVRLPTAVVPTLYTMELNASLTEQHFTGTMAMELTFIDKTTEIIFHARDLDIDHLRFTVPRTAPGSDATVVTPEGGYIGVFDLYRVQLPFFMGSGRVGTLSMRFSAPISHGLAGFYLSDYKDAQGATHTIASTQFEAVSARLAFPCFDEPSFKANFSVAITTEAAHKTILSNMPPLGPPVILPGGSFQRIAFQTTPRMSTYLLAYVICDFVSIEGLTSRGIPVRVWAAVDKIDQAGVALKAGIDSINKYESFFQLVSQSRGEEGGRRAQTAQKTVMRRAAISFFFLLLLTALFAWLCPPPPPHHAFLIPAGVSPAQIGPNCHSEFLCWGDGKLGVGDV